ncbi:MAG: hypothetical protein GY950_29200, partial [bacterium]|nr:hypothetical protein [bacterium]
NPGGFEVYFALHEFRQLLGLDVDPVTEKRWPELQVNGYYDFQSQSMAKNCCDPAVLKARMYEAVWLPDIELNIAS